MSTEKKIIRIGKNEGKTKKEKIKDIKDEPAQKLTEEELKQNTLTRGDKIFEEKMLADIKAFEATKIIRKSDLIREQDTNKQKLENLFRPK